MVTRRNCIRFGPTSWVAVLALGTLGAAPALGAQEPRATVAVTAQVAAPGTGISRLGTPSVLASAMADGREARSVAAGEATIRSVSRFELWVRRAAGAGWTGEAAGRADSARVWVRDDRGALRRLVAGGAVLLGARPAGEHAPPTLDYRVDGVRVGRVELVYEVRVASGAQ